MKNCSHPSCSCQFDKSRMIESSGRLYCSEHCAGRGQGDDAPCACGHPECKTHPG